MLSLVIPTRRWRRFFPAHAYVFIQLNHGGMMLVLTHAGLFRFWVTRQSFRSQWQSRLVLDRREKELQVRALGLLVYFDCRNAQEEQEHMARCRARDEEFERDWEADMAAVMKRPDPPRRWFDSWVRVR